jgi:iron complex transport system ATP-binding protein
VSALLELRNVSFSYFGRPVIEQVTAGFEAGELAAIAGPNGAGKSTLLGVCAGLRAPYGGNCLYQGKEVRQWKQREFARQVAFVPQSLRMEFAFTAGQVVLMGRAPYGDGLFESDEDLQAAREAMRMTDALEFWSRDFRTLSGGERQRVILAASLAQSPRVLLLDEPTTFLDLKHQLSIYSLLAELSRKGLLVITVTHDLNLAASFADRVLVLRGGRAEALGPAKEVLTGQLIARVFEVSCSIQSDGGDSWWIRYDR